METAHKTASIALVGSVAIFGGPTLYNATILQIDHLNLFCAVRADDAPAKEDPAIQRAYDELASRDAAQKRRMEERRW